MPPQQASLWYQWTPDYREDGRRRGFPTLNEFAVKLARACDEQLKRERRNFPRLPEAEVEEATRAIPDYPDGVVNLDDLMPMLRDFHFRHGVAESSDGVGRRD